MLQGSQACSYQDAKPIEERECSEARVLLRESSFLKAMQGHKGDDAVDDFIADVMEEVE